jgi:hypothetical protein
VPTNNASRSPSAFPNEAKHTVELRTFVREDDNSTKWQPVVETFQVTGREIDVIFAVLDTRRAAAKRIRGSRRPFPLLKYGQDGDWDRLASVWPYLTEREKRAVVGVAQELSEPDVDGEAQL